MDPALDHHRIAASLAGQVLGHDVRYLPKTTSTNDEVHTLAGSGHAEGLVVFTDSQTHGRGRRGARWLSTPRKDLLFSVLLRPASGIETWTRLAHMAALAVAEALDNASSVPPQIKWPNDVYLRGRKVAGLLVENRVQASQPPYAVLGIGVNVNSSERDFPLSLRALATSLRVEQNGQMHSREAVAIAIFHALNQAYTTCQADFAAVLQKLKARSFLLGQRVRARIGGRQWIGEAIDYTEDGSLLVKLDNGASHTLAAVDSIRVL